MLTAMALAAAVSLAEELTGAGDCLVEVPREVAYPALSVPTTLVGKGLVPGGTVRLTSTTSVKDWLKPGTVYPLTQGANLAAEDVTTFTVELFDRMKAYKATLKIVDGELCVTFRELRGMVLLFR